MLPEIHVKRTDSRKDNDTKRFPKRRPKLSLIIPHRHQRSPQLQHAHQSTQNTHSSKPWPHRPLRYTRSNSKRQTLVSTARSMSIRRFRATAVEQAISDSSESNRLPPLLPEAERLRRCHLPRLRLELGVGERLYGVSMQPGQSQLLLQPTLARRRGDEMDFRTGPSSCGMFWPPF